VFAEPAFPGAAGFGAEASGGRGGEVVYVTTLADDGPGSLRDAVRQGRRTILFQLSGTIELQSPLVVGVSDVTIAGQSAPGDGVCLRGKGLVIRGNNVIVRFLRLRPGDERGEEHDALTIWGARNVMVDHCSLSWSTDSINDVVRDSSLVTVQWCILSEPLNTSVHVKGAHGYGTGWGSGPEGGNSFHHNLLAHCNSRSPRLGSEHDALVDVRNNVIFNRGSGWAYGGEHARVNYVANYLKPGPNTQRPAELFRFSHQDTRMYLRGNVVEGASHVTADNTLGLSANDGLDPQAAIVSEPFPAPPLPQQSADAAYGFVLQHSGACLPRRDAVDTRIVDDVRHGTGQIINSQRDVGGWPELQSAPPAPDADGDGMPDAWERDRGLNPNDVADGRPIAEDGFSELEHYLNELAAPVANEHNEEISVRK
jgi:pectate lyase